MELYTLEVESLNKERIVSSEVWRPSEGLASPMR